MLHLETVESGTLSVLKRLMSLSQLKGFYLVGGTALSLQYGHRISIDLDLFCNQEFDSNAIKIALQKEFSNEFEYEGDFSKFGIFCFIQNIKVDIVYYPHPIVFDPIKIEDIRMYSPKDIAAMKIQAILGRGKKKDLWDIAELFQHYDLKDIIAFHKQKFPSQQLLISIPQALTYFVDADESEDPISLKEQTWESVKRVIQQKVNDYLK